MVLNFVGSQDGSTTDFHLTCPETSIIRSSERRESLAEVGIKTPSTLNVTWDGVSENVRRIIKTLKTKFEKFPEKFYIAHHSRRNSRERNSVKASFLIINCIIYVIY